MSFQINLYDIGTSLSSSVKTTTLNSSNNALTLSD